MSIALPVIAFVVVCGVFASPPQLLIVSVLEVAGVVLGCGTIAFKPSLKLWVQFSPSPLKYIGWDWNRGCVV